MSQRIVHWFGSRALLMDLSGLDEALALQAALKSQPLAGQEDLIPAVQTLLVRFISHYHARQAQAHLAAMTAPATTQAQGRLHEIPVVYDGPDLADVAAQTGLSTDEIIQLHTGQTWQAAFSGFAPGFVYMVGEHDKLHVSRRDSPRTAVPTGAVGLAGAFSAIYPRCSPGGWQLIGRTDAQLWDLERDPPALIQAGDRVRYVAVDQLQDDPQANEQADSQPTARPQASKPSQGLEVQATGLQTLVQDQGRPGLSHLGVSQSGAADADAARQANQQVGNPPHTAVLENMLGGLALKAHGDQILSCTGAPTSVHIDGHTGPRRAPRRTAFILHDGEILQLGSPEAGLRCYIGIRGGLDLPAVLGSRAYDLMAAIGPPPLQAGQMLAVSTAASTAHIGTSPPLAMPGTTAEPTVLRVVIGPRHDWFDTASQQRFFQQTWQISQQANRAGLRLQLDEQAPDAQALQRGQSGELASEGMQPGAVQIPPSGLPVVFLRDHPVTGGYPVMACLIEADLSRAAQLRPGQRLQFQAVDPQTLAPLSTTAPTQDEESRSCKRS